MKKKKKARSNAAQSYWFYLCNYFLVRLVRRMNSLALLRVVAARRVVAIWLAQTSTRRKSLLSRLFRPWWGKKKKNQKWLQQRSVPAKKLRWCRMTNDTQVARIIWISAWRRCDCADYRNENTKFSGVQVGFEMPSEIRLRLTTTTSHLSESL